MIVKMSLGHALYVARNMRENDWQEICATRWDEDPDSFAAECFRLPGTHFAAVDESGEPVAVGGVALHTPGVGQAWLVGTEAFPSLAIEVTRFCKASVEKMLASELHRIHAYSAAFHVESHRWLEAAGLSRHELPLRQWGRNGEDFYLFEAIKGG